MEEGAANRAEAGKADEEFEVGFFQGYTDMKMRVTVDHPEWDLIAYSGVESDFWDVESPANKEAPVDKEGRTEGAKAAEEAKVEVVDPPA